MFGIKKKIAGFLMDHAPRHSFVDPAVVNKFMTFFVADEYGHRADSERGDLGFGWLHYGLIRTYKPKNILCIGSRHGFIPAVLAQAARDNGVGHVDFVDAGYGEDDIHNWTGVGYWQTESGRTAFHRYNPKSQLANYLSLHVMTTTEFSRLYPELQYQYIYIDGDHSYQGVKKDFTLFYPRLEHGGFLSFHDISVKEPTPEGTYGVHRLWAELKKKNHHLIEYPFVGSGLGVLQKQKKEQ